MTARVTLGYMGEAAGDEEEEPNLIAVVPLMDEQQRTVSVLLTVASILCFPICYGGGAALCAALFYRRKLKGPIALLDMASRKIAEKDLDFAIHWDRRDEMGALCASFEEMRRALWENNRVMWRQMEERKRLNAAFAHDLRTPLTVLSGYAGMLRARPGGGHGPRGHGAGGKRDGGAGAPAGGLRAGHEQPAAAGGSAGPARLGAFFPTCAPRWRARWTFCSRTGRPCWTRPLKEGRRWTWSG